MLIAQPRKLSPIWTFGVWLAICHSPISARLAARNDEPTSESTSLNAAEAEIVEAVGAAQKSAYDELENHLSGFRQRLVDLDFKTQFSSIILFGHSVSCLLAVISDARIIESPAICSGISLSTIAPSLIP